MKTVLLPVHPNWLELILSGKKTVEVRKTKPKEAVPFRVLLYCTKGGGVLYRSKYDWTIRLTKDNRETSLSHHDILNGKVVAEFVCDFVTEHNANNQIQAYYNGTAETVLYAKGKRIYYWHISDLKIYDNPKELSEFRKPCIYNLECSGCEFAYWTHDNGFEGCMLEEGLKKSPQSWCYVEV